MGRTSPCDLWNEATTPGITYCSTSINTSVSPPSTYTSGSPRGRPFVPIYRKDLTPVRNRIQRMQVLSRLRRLRIHLRVSWEIVRIDVSRGKGPCRGGDSVEHHRSLAPPLETPATLRCNTPFAPLYRINTPCVLSRSSCSSHRSGRRPGAVVWANSTPRPCHGWGCLLSSTWATERIGRKVRVEGIYSGSRDGST